MPCRSDYLEPSGREKEGILVAHLLVYVANAKKRDVPTWVINGTDNLDKATDMLCKECSNMSKEEQDRIIYDGRNPMARQLAEWWDKHQELDRQRKKEEKEVRHSVRLSQEVVDIIYEIAGAEEITPLDVLRRALSFEYFFYKEKENGIFKILIERDGVYKQVKFDKRKKVFNKK